MNNIHNSEKLEEKTMPFIQLKSGNIEIRLAKTAEEIENAQALRFKIFQHELKAHPLYKEMVHKQSDFDKYDAYCDHLIAIDHEKNEKIVGNYRLMRRSAAQKCGTFYSSNEYNIDKIQAYPGEILELGRACVEEEYRGKKVLPMLWKAIEQYIQFFEIELLFGCASFPGTDAKAFVHGLSYLYHFHLALEYLCPKALDQAFIPMNILAKEEVDKQKAQEQLPSLIKGYLHLGAFVGEGGFLDKYFNVIDVCIIILTKQLRREYIERFFCMS